MAKQNFSVARIETRTRATVGKFERHIERKNDSYENMNVDLSRTPMNVTPTILNRTAAMNMPADSTKKLSILQKSSTVKTILYLL